MSIFFIVALDWLAAAGLSIVYSWWCAWRQSQYEAVIHQEGRDPIDMEYYTGWSNHYGTRVQFFGDDVPVLFAALGFMTFLIGMLVWLVGKMVAE